MQTLKLETDEDHREPRRFDDELVFLADFRECDSDEYCGVVYLSITRIR